MSNQKLKDEHYQNLGGINSKISPYLNGPQEFLDLKNFDFQTPGSLTQRWGSTQYTSGASFSGKITGLYEFSKFDGSASIIASHTGAIWSINASLSVGVSAANFYATFGSGGWSLAYGTTKRFACYLPISSYASFANYGTFDLAGYYSYGSVHIKNIGIVGDNFDIVQVNDNLYAANGTNFLKYTGSSLFYFGLPVGMAVNSDFNTAGATIVTTASIVASKGFGPSLYYNFALQYYNNDGFKGEPGWIGRISPGSSYRTVEIQGLTLPSFYNISRAQLLCTRGYTATSPYSVSTTYYSTDYLVYGTSQIVGNLFAPNGGATTVGNIGTYLAPDNVSWYDERDIFTDEVVYDYQYIPDILAGPTLKITGGGRFSYYDVYTPQSVFAPKYLEFYQNRLFMAGYSQGPSSVWFSDVGVPEATSSEWNFEVRTNDGDSITCLRNYGPRLLIFKENSYHVLTGDNPTNFSLSQVSDEYGCINNKCAITFNDLFVFLDRKGLMQYNGASTDYLSDKVQPIIERVNWSAAKTTAFMINDKARNQVLIALPVDGSSVNNLTLVYDYLVKAWTSYDGFNPAYFNVMSGRLSTRSLFMGGYSANILNFGQSLPSDNGTGFTCYGKAPFMSPSGQSVEKQFRRLFMNVDEVNSATVPININFFKNYGSSTVLNRTMYLSPFQSRIDFGISAKSLSFEFSKFSATTYIKLHGFALAHRYQRDS